MVVSVQESTLSRVLDTASRITRQLTPSLGEKLEVHRRLVPQIAGGWFFISPDSAGAPPLISEAIDNRTAVLVYGEVEPAGESSAAEQVLRTWHQGGTNAVRSLDANFAAIVVDLPTSTLFIMSDLIGHRALRYHQSGDCLLISTHDLPIVATGLCPTEFDLVSACSIVSMEWSIGGQSLLKHVPVCHPNEYVQYSKAGLKRVPEPLISSNQRIEPGDKRACKAQIQGMIDHMQHRTRRACTGEADIALELTGGLDSRAALAVLHSVVDADRVAAYTQGEKRDLDVAMARCVARTYGLRHETRVPDAPSTDQFSEHARLLAWHMNGDTNGKRALSPLPMCDFTPAPHVAAVGGEIYRRYYHSHVPDGGPELSVQWALEKLQDHFRNRASRFTWQPPGIVEQLGERFGRTVAPYAALCDHGSDALNLFYLLERFGRWGAIKSRFTWRTPHFSPFMSPRLVQMAFELPSPIVHNCP